MSTPRDPRSFDDLPEHFERFSELSGGQIEAYLTERLPARGGRAVDLGSGPGRHAMLMAERFDEVLAVDVSPTMLEFAREHRSRPNITYQERPLEEVHRDTDGTFDLIFSAYTLHHVADLAKTLDQLRDLLRPGGQAIFIDIVAERDIADENGLVPRAWFIEEAVKGFAMDLAGNQRPLAEAAEFLALNLDPGWLAHITTDRHLTRADFAEQYGAAFPGGVITDLYRTRALHYTETASP